MALGPTGQFPEGQLNPTDEGEIKIAIGVERDRIVIHFGKPISWIGFNPKQAREIAEMIRKQSYKVGK